MTASTKVALQVSIPLPGNIVPKTGCVPATPQTNPTPAAPTGVVWNPTTNAATAFLVPGTNLPASFIFVTEDGTISAWTGGLTPANNAVLAVDNSQVPNAASGAVYKAAVMSVNVNGVFLYVTNFRAGTIEVYDHNYKLVTTDGGFVDPNIPAGFAPFGPFSGMILIGNFGNGRINVFDEHGRFVDELDDGHDRPLVIDGLWTLTLGGGAKSSPDTLYFTAGPNAETDGLFGTITPVTHR